MNFKKSSWFKNTIEKAGQDENKKNWKNWKVLIQKITKNYLDEKEKNKIMVIKNMKGSFF